MNYLIQITNFWRLHQQHDLNTTDTALYFYLLEVCNSANWVNPIKRNSMRIMADLNLSTATFYRSRNRLNELGIITFTAHTGIANATYHLADLATAFTENKVIVYNDNDRGIDSSADSGIDKGNDSGIDSGINNGVDSGTDSLNKNNKQKQKPVVAVVGAGDAYAFFKGTKNCRLLKEKFGLADAAIENYFQMFYDSKIDLGDLDNKTTGDVARNFYYWLPKHLAATGKNSLPGSAPPKNQPQQPLRGVAAALKFADVKMRE